MKNPLIVACDKYKVPLPLVALVDSQDVNGTSASAQSAAIDGWAVRIVSIDNALRVVAGIAGEDESHNVITVATSTDILIPALGELWLPITPTYVVAVLGGKANICTAGL